MLVCVNFKGVDSNTHSCLPTSTCVYYSSFTTSRATPSTAHTHTHTHTPESIHQRCVPHAWRGPLEERVRWTVWRRIRPPATPVRTDCAVVAILAAAKRASQPAGRRRERYDLILPRSQTEAVPLAAHAVRVQRVPRMRAPPVQRRRVCHKRPPVVDLTRRNAIAAVPHPHRLRSTIHDLQHPRNVTRVAVRRRLWWLWRRV